MKTINNDVNDNMSNNNETKVMCPVCGTEFAIGEHEHRVKNAISIGKDSGLGEVYLPVSKRGDALKAACLICTMLPIMTIYPFVQKYFIAGLMIGSVKG